MKLSPYQIQECKELGLLGSMISQEREIYENLDQDSKDQMEWLFGPGYSPEFYFHDEDDDGSHLDFLTLVDFTSLQDMEDYIDEKNGNVIVVKSPKKNPIPALHKKHNEFLDYIKEELLVVATFRSLDTIYALCDSHDARMKSNGYLCNTYKQLYAECARAYKRIKASNWIKFPVLLTKTQLQDRKAEAVVYNTRQLEYHKAQGWCVVVFPARKEVMAI